MDDLDNDWNFSSALVHWMILAIFTVAFIPPGCDSLHRDLEPTWEDDAGGFTDIEDFHCSPGAECGPCGEGEQVCDDEDRFQCQGSVDLDADNENCGSCGSECATVISGVETTCEGGQCHRSCPDEGETACEDQAVCADLSTDEDNCGACGNVCSSDGDGVESVHCESGECIKVCGDLEQTYCESADACIDLNSTHGHCGECDASCVPGHCCLDGQCTGGNQC